MRRALISDFPFTAESALSMPSKPRAVRLPGGVRQIEIENAGDLACLESIDPALWAATSIPLRDLHCDPALVKILDPSGCGRLRTDGLIEMRDWLFARLAFREGIEERRDSVRADDLDASRAEGQRLRQTALHLLSELGRAPTDSLGLKDVRDFRASYSKRLINGDGVVAAAQIEAPAIAAFVKNIIAMVGGTRELSGETGVGKAELVHFREEAARFRAWQARGQREAALHPLGDSTAEAYALVDSLRPKVEEFFYQCSLLELEGRQQDDLRLKADALRDIAAKGRESLADYLRASPLATPTPECALPFDGPLNPLFADPLRALRARVIAQMPGGAAVTALTPSLWKEVEVFFGPYADWQRARPKAAFETIDAELLDGSQSAALDAELTALIDRDLSAQGEFRALDDLEKLLLFQRWILDVAGSIANFAGIHAPKERALIDAGCLVIDGRRLEFCLRVFDRKAHRPVASESLLFLVYAAISEKEGAPVAFEIVAPVTAGERGRLRLGKRGLFIDHEGRHWDAVIVDLVENPISLSEAIRAPFKRAINAASEKIEALTASRLKAQEDVLGGKIQGSLAKIEAASTAKPGAAPPEPAKASANMRDLLLGGGIAFAALGSALAYTVSALSEVEPLKALLVATALALSIALLLSFMSWRKLRRRDLSLLFEANGWAVNARLKLSRKLGQRFTVTPKLPRGGKAAGGKS